MSAWVDTFSGGDISTPLTITVNASNTNNTDPTYDNLAVVNTATITTINANTVTSTNATIGAATIADAQFTSLSTTDLAINQSGVTIIPTPTGTLSCWMPFQGTGYKVAIIRLDNVFCTSTTQFTYTFPTSFTLAPDIQQKTYASDGTGDIVIDSASSVTMECTANNNSNRMYVLTGF